MLPAAAPAEAMDLAGTHADTIHLLMTDMIEKVRGVLDGSLDTNQGESTRAGIS